MLLRMGHNGFEDCPYPKGALAPNTQVAGHLEQLREPDVIEVPRSHVKRAGDLSREEGCVMHAHEGGSYMVGYFSRIVAACLCPCPDNAHGSYHRIASSNQRPPGIETR